LRGNQHCTATEEQDGSLQSLGDVHSSILRVAWTLALCRQRSRSACGSGDSGLDEIATSGIHLLSWLVIRRARVIAPDVHIEALFFRLEACAAQMQLPMCAVA
jgi:hypothetical protein